MDIFYSLIPFFTAVAGALLAHGLSERNAKRSRAWSILDRHADLAIEKGEELYSLIHAWNLAAGSSFIHYRKVMMGELDYNDALDSVISSASASANHQRFERIDLLISVYFPAIRPDFDALKQLVYKATSIEYDYRNRYKMGQFDSGNHLPAYDVAMLQAEKVTTALLIKLSSLVRAETDRLPASRHQ